MRKYALLIGVSDYQAPVLKPLLSARSDGMAMQRILQHPDMGGFAAEDITLLTNPKKSEVEAAIYRLFAGKRSDDLLLFYFSGHGIKDETGKLYFALPETLKEQGSLVKYTAIAASLLHESMNDSRSECQVLVLDCCFSGAIAKGMTVKDDGAVDLRSQLGGRGRAIFTAASSMQYAFQQDDRSLSIYTQFFVEGIEKGAADLDGDGLISADELHQYVFDKVQKEAPAMTPQFYPIEQGHRIYLAKSPKDDPVLKYRKEVERWVKQGAFSVERDRFSPAAKSLLTEQRQRLELSIEVAESIEREVLQPLREYQRKQQRYRQTVVETLEDEGYPFGETTQNVLRELQMILGLRDEDVRAIETPLVTEWRRQEEQRRIERDAVRSTAAPPVAQPLVSPPTPVAVPPSSSQNPVRQPSPTPSPTAVKPRPAPQPSVNSRSNWSRQRFLKWLGFGGGGLTLALLGKSIADSQSPSSQPQPQPQPQPQQQSSTTASPVQRPQPLSVSSSIADLKDFSFEVVTVNAQGQETQRQTQQAKAFVEDLGNGVTLEMVAIPKGNFQMGSPENEKDRGSDESPQHSVTVPAFLMGRYAVTQAQYEAVMGNNPAKFKGANRPVEQVSWHNAQEFCKRLSQKTGRKYRLPSEAEWEYACRAGTTTPFHSGETITTDLANYRGTDWEFGGTTYPGNYGAGPKGKHREQTIDIGSFPANAFGLHDMHGNVWEWCEDVYHENYQGAPIDGSAWIEGGKQDRRLLRGGSWILNPHNCRSANRGAFAPDVRYGPLGFRVVGVLA